jgi:hypothetical protein
VDRATVRTRHIAWGTINLGETMSACGVLRWIEPAARHVAQKEMLRTTVTSVANRFFSIISSPVIPCLIL